MRSGVVRVDDFASLRDVDAKVRGEQAAIEHWQIKRDKTLRGIVEVIGDDDSE